MQAKLRRFAAALVGAAATLATTSGIACTVAPVQPQRIKQLMAQEIAYRLGLRPEQISLDSISTPQLVTPLGLSADCSGLAAYHHTAGFRVWDGASKEYWRRRGPRLPGPWVPPGSPWVPPVPWPYYPYPFPISVAGPHTANDPVREPVPAQASPTQPGNPAAPWTGGCMYEGVAVVLGQGYSSPVAVNFERICR